MEIYLIRHGKTKGNLEKRYVGRTDEELLLESCEMLKKKREALPLDVDQVYTSPLRRCRQTAQLLFPETAVEVENDLRETDFGEFEYLTYEDLKENKAYQNWIDSMGMGHIPNGESGLTFRKRCEDGFAACLLRAAKRGQKSIALTVHGGTIMAVLDRFTDEKRDFYGWQVSNGCGYKIRWELPDELKGLLSEEIAEQQRKEKCKAVIRLQVEDMI